LNGLYGYFGRNNIINSVDIITNLEDFYDIYRKYEVYNEIIVDENLFIIIRDFLPSKKICQTFNIDYLEEYKKSYYKSRINNNIAIASAITSYARIEINKYKFLKDINLFYTDTDSIIIDKPLPSNLISNSIGLMKDVLKGDKIKEGIFISPKLYGYKTYNNDEKIVARGIPINTLTFEDIKDIYNGKEITKCVNKLFKNINDLTIKSRNIDIKTKNLYMKNVKIPIFDKDNNLIGYKPIHINFLKGALYGALNYKFSYLFPFNVN